MRAAIIAVIAGLGLLALLWNPFAGLLLYTWFTFFRPQEWAYGGLVAYRLSLVIGAALLARAAIIGAVPNVTSPLTAGSLLFLIWTVGTAPWAYDPPTAWTAVNNLAPAIIVALVGVSLTTSRQRFVAFVGVGVGSLAVHGVWRGLSLLAGGGGPIRAGIGGTFNDNNAFGLALVRIIFFVVAVALLAERRSVRLAAWGMVPPVLVTIIFTYSRGAFLALAAGGLCFLLLQRRKGLAAVAAIVGVSVFFFAAPAGYHERLGTITTFEEGGDLSALGRLHFWRVAVEMVKDRSVGVGIGNFERAYDAYDFTDGAFGVRRAVHSTHFQALAETGWVGFALFEGLFLYTLYAALRMRRRARRDIGKDRSQRLYLYYSNAIIASSVAFLVGGSFLSQVLSELNWFTFAWTAALERLQQVGARNAGSGVTPRIAAPARAPGAHAAVGGPGAHSAR